MQKNINTKRIGILFVVFATVVIVYIISLYDLQIINGEAYLEVSQNNISSTTTIEASRGSVYDRNGNLLISNQAVNNITINWPALSASEDTNGIILSLVSAAKKHEVSYNDSLPVSQDAPFAYTEMIEEQGENLAKYLKYYKHAEDISAVELMAHLRKTYNVDPSYSAQDARAIVGIRYEIDLRYAIPNLSPYVFAEDVGTDFIAVVGEQNLIGVEVTETSARKYHTTYAAHILGSTGLMTAEEYEVYKKSGYPMNAYVGKDGIEKAFESYLHGENGTKTITYNSSGSIIDEVVTKEARSGGSVNLTIDIELQAVVENALSDTINELNSERGVGDDKADAGAAVVLDVNSGEILAMASNPTYNLETYSQDFNDLASDTASPLTNRAAFGLYQPGSTFKMLTAIAALDTGQILPYTTYSCAGSYSIGDYTYGCLGRHGSISLVTAIEKSCNVYFYNIAYNMDINTLAEYAEKFGFGSATGLELGEAVGVVASEEYERSLYELYQDEYYSHWYVGQTLHAAIGQSYHQFTPIQLANYAATIAAGGTRYRTHLLREVHDTVTGEMVYCEEPELLGTVDVNSEYFDVIKQGMEAVAKSGTISSVFKDLDIKIAAKTGTSQTGNDIDDGVFVCYAPAEDPQIAIAVVIEKGGSGTKTSNVAKDILKYYFNTNNGSNKAITENTMLG